ncbi:MAG: hypothetical protein K6C35_10745 [Eubacterium sp.]|nr:hypothetical protein [Eubacterium sp.]SEF65939.1 Putative Flagellin, Flp1-like, domain [Eubacterium ruminantium]
MEERTNEAVCMPENSIKKTNNKGAISIEVILILVVLIALIVIFKAQIMGVANTIWKGINNSVKSIVS